MPEPIKLQLAIQGGGARLCALLAMAEAVQELELARQIRVTRLAGTSAGALIACLLATEQPITSARQRLRDRGADSLSLIAPPLGRLNAWSRVIRGLPLYDEERLREFLSEFFPPSRFRTFAELKRPVTVLAADILNGEKVPYGAPGDVIIDALANSCALPFAFRSHRNGGPQPVVDGGICENLPSDELTADQEHGQVVGISFARMQVPHLPESVMDFAKALLNTAMQNSMNRARQRIGPGAVFDIRTHIGTFDFQKAVSEGLADHYERVKADTEKWFSGLVQLRQGPGNPELLLEDPWREPGKPAIEMMERIERVFDAQHGSVQHAIDKASLVCIGYSCLPDGDRRQAHPDVVKQIFKVRPLGEPLYGFPISLGSETASTGQNSWSVTDARGENVDKIVVPIIKRRGSTDIAFRRDVIVFFIPPLVPDPSREPYTVVEQDLVLGVMSPLKKKGRDFLEFESERRVPIAHTDLVVFVPAAMAAITMVPYNPPGARKTIPGEDMTPRELQEYGDPPNGDPPVGFRAIGWSGRNLQPGARLAVEFVVQS